MNVELATQKAAEEAKYWPLKEDQTTSIEHFVRGKNVFVVLPTGYGKSACYACIPRAIDFHKDRLSKEDSSIIVVISPLTALIKDQVENLSKRGTSAGYIDKDSTAATKQDVHSGSYNVLFMSPEILVSNWRSLFSSKIYQKRLVGLVIDEAHCVIKW